MALSRRAFLSGTGALVLAFGLPRPARAAGSMVDGDSGTALSAFVRIEPDGSVVLKIPSSEMGQGATTALAMVLAEELDADWERVRVEHAEAAAPFQKRLPLGIRQQVTGGSDSLVYWRDPLREVGAACRAVLVAAASERLGVDPDRLATRDSTVVYGETVLPYTALLAEAAALRLPKKPVLKDPSRYRLVGRDVRRKYFAAKITGAAEFGADVRLEGMVYATSRQCPVFGGTVVSVDDAAARAIPGVLDVCVFEDFVAVVAEHFWEAKRGLEALRITWDEGPHAALSSERISAEMRAALDGPRWNRGEKRGRGARGLGDDAIEAVYEVPYLHHATMAPINATAWVTDERCEIWAPTQVQTLAVQAAAKRLRRPKRDIVVHTSYLGGGFGRRGNTDDIEQVVRIAERVGRPVQLLWTREEGVAHGFYRPAAVCRMRGSVADGTLTALTGRVVSDTPLKRYVPGILLRLPLANTFPQEGLTHLPYGIADLEIDYVMKQYPVPIGFWRSVGFSSNSFFAESFVDELAHAAGRDPVELRLELLAGAPRYARVLRAAVEGAAYGSAPAGRVQGVALAESFGSIVAEVVEISLDAGGLRVHGVTVAVDCGPVVHPENVEAQMMGGVGFALSEALRGKITLERGRVVQSNFHDYPLLRMEESPEVRVHIVSDPEAEIGGIGEVAVPPLAPALCNAIFRATGQRIRTLPILDVLELPS